MMPGSQKKVFLCDFCKSDRVPVQYHSGYALRRHFWAQHAAGLSRRNTCNIDGCPVSITNQRSFGKHLRRYHPGVEWIPTLSPLVTTSTGNYASATDESNDADVVMNVVPSFSEPLIEPALLTNLTKNASCTSSTNSATCSNTLNADITDHMENGETNSPLPSTPSRNTDASQHLHSFDQSHDNVIDEDVEIYLHYTQLTAKEKQLQALVSLYQLRTKFNLTQAALCAIMEFSEEMLHNAVRPLVGYLKHENALSEDEMEPIIDLASDVINPFKGLESEWMMNKVMKSIGYVVG